METGDIQPRKDYFIKKWLQFKFTFIFIITIIFGNILFGGYVFKVMRQHLNYHLYSSHSKLKSTWEVIEGAVLKTSVVSIISFVILFLIVIYLITKRLSRGFDEISNDLKVMNTGDIRGECDVVGPPTISDLLKDFNDIKCNLRANINESKDTISKLNTALDKLDNCTSGKDKRGIVEVFEELESYNNELTNKINRINV
jgi:methyl-accepting chemotaxis protein